jgi:hypothetical protein
MGCHGHWAELIGWIGGPTENAFKFISKILIQIKEFKYFQTKFELNST